MENSLKKTKNKIKEVKIKRCKIFVSAQDYGLKYKKKAPQNGANGRQEYGKEADAWMDYSYFGPVI